MVQPTLRPATPADVEAAVRIHAAAIKERGPEAYTPRQVAAWALEARPDAYPVDAPDRCLLAADLGEAIVGVGQANLDDPEIAKLFVDPTHAERGVGSQLLAALESALAEAKAKTVFLDASLNSVEFYERHGYEYGQVLTKRLPYGSETVVYPTIRMSKRLQIGADEP